MFQTTSKDAMRFAKRAAILNGLYSIGYTFTYIEALWLVFIPSKSSTLTPSGAAINNYCNSCFVWIGISNLFGTKYKDPRSMRLLLLGDAIGFFLWFLFDIYHYNVDFYSNKAFNWPFYFIAAPVTLLCSIHSLIAYLKFPRQIDSKNE